MQTQTKMRASDLFCTSAEGICLYEWDSDVSFEKAHYQGAIVFECFCLHLCIYMCDS